MAGDDVIDTMPVCPCNKFWQLTERLFLQHYLNAYPYLSIRGFSRPREVRNHFFDRKKLMPLLAQFIGMLRIQIVQRQTDGVEPGLNQLQ